MASSSSRPQRTRTHRATLAVVALAVSLTLSGCAASQTSAFTGLPSDDHGASGGNARTSENGYIPAGGALSPFDNEHPALVNLDAGLRTALARAATDAGAAGIEMVVNSGWRSERYQQALLDEAIITYGSEAEARKWVNTPGRSTHVKGRAVDIGYTDADSWLSQHGARYGLCQTFANEMWHFELAIEAGGTCPAPISDASVG